MSDYPKEFLDLLDSVTAKRPRTVIQHILEHGFITSEELKDTYGNLYKPCFFLQWLVHNRQKFALAER